MTMDHLPSEPKRTSPWVWVGVGCGGVVLLGVIAVAVVGFFIVARVRNFEKQFKDPAERERRVREVMGARDIPEGYHPFMTFSVPWVLDVAILTDRQIVKAPKGGGAPFDRRGFIYVRMPYKGKDAELNDYLDGKRSPDELLKGRDMHFHPRDTVGRGSVQGEGGVTYRYVATRGEVQMGREVKEGITSVIAIDCPNDPKFRLGVWFGPDPTAKGGEGAPAKPEGASPPPAGDAAEPGGTGPASAAFAGSPADEEAMKEFLSHFELCR